MLKLDIPVGTCGLCGSYCKVVKMLTFSYWYCAKCKDEPNQVYLQTNRNPKGAKEKYALEADTDIVIAKPGVYRLDYIDGSRDFYEQREGDKELRLYREYVQASSRIADCDMPSRVRLQTTQGANQGTGTQGNGLGTVPAAKACCKRSAGISNGAVRLYASGDIKQALKNLCGRDLNSITYQYDFSTETVYWQDDSGTLWEVPNYEFESEYSRVRNSGPVSVSPPDSVWLMEQSNISLQLRKVFPRKWVPDQSNDCFGKNKIKEGKP
jgi:hypothetical protein